MSRRVSIRCSAAVSFSFKVNCPSDFDCAPDDRVPGTAIFRRRTSTTSPRTTRAFASCCSIGWPSPCRIGASAIRPTWASRSSSCSPTPAINSVTTRTRWRPRRTSTRRADGPACAGTRGSSTTRCTTARTRAPGWSFETDVDRGNIAAPAVPQKTTRRRTGDRDAAGARLRDDARRDRAARQPQRDPVLHVERRELLSSERRHARHARGRRSAAGSPQGRRAALRRSARRRKRIAGRRRQDAPSRGAACRGTDRANRSADAYHECWTSAGTTRTPCRFRLCLREFANGARAAVARGNVALADHGQTFLSASAGDDLVPSEVGERPYRPVLKKAGLTQAVAFDAVDAADKSAAAATSVDGRARRCRRSSCAPTARRGGRSAICSRATGLRRSSSWRPRSMVVAIHGRICASATAYSVASLPRVRASTANIGLAAARLATSALTRVTQMKPAVPGVKVRNPLPAQWRCRSRANARGPAVCPAGVSHAGAGRDRGRLRRGRAAASRRAACRLHSAMDGHVPHDVHHRRSPWRQAGDARVRTGAA